MRSLRVEELRSTFVRLVTPRLFAQTGVLRTVIGASEAVADSAEDLGYLLDSAQRLLTTLEKPPPATLDPHARLGHQSHSTKGALHPVCGFTDLCQGIVGDEAVERELATFRQELSRTLVLSECFFDLPRWSNGFPPLDLDEAPITTTLGIAAETAATVLGLPASPEWRSLECQVLADPHKLGRALGVLFVTSLEIDPQANVWAKETRTFELGIRFSFAKRADAASLFSTNSRLEGLRLVVSDALEVIAAHGARVSFSADSGHSVTIPFAKTSR